jgi:hypothetical protein
MHSPENNQLLVEYLCENVIDWQQLLPIAANEASSALK